MSSKLAPFPSVFLTLYRPLEEAVDLLGDRVEVEARPVRGGDAEPSYQRLTAMVPGADRDAPPVEDLGDVVRMDALDSNETIPRAPLRWVEDREEALAASEQGRSTPKATWLSLER